MPSKGVQVYTYIAVQGCTVELSVPQQTVVKQALNVFSSDDLEVDAANISSFFDKDGRFTFNVSHNGTQLTEQWVEVNALTGLVSDGTMTTIAQTPSILSNGILICYGFYVAGSGEEGLPSRHQCYVTVTPNYAGWMGSVAPLGSPQAAKPFSQLVLPAVHDVGMNSMQNCDAVLQHAGGAVINLMLPGNKVLEALANDISSGAVMDIAPNIVASLAITQKDVLATLLQIGARYFEFRPAHCHKDILPVSPLPDKLYFQHSAIPGMAYDQFLHDTVSFLVANPTEIVVVQLRWDGVPAECARPTDKELSDYLNSALAISKGSVIAGGLTDLQNATISQLRSERKRLIMLNNVNSLSTYTDAGNATLNGDSIVAEFQKLLTPQNETPGTAFINIQCQATATNITGAVVYSILTASVSTSCLLSTKGICDSKTLPWVRANTTKVCKKGELVVIMNDFFDGGTADVAVALSRQRL
jgi:hypothetical protein